MNGRFLSPRSFICLKIGVNVSPRSVRRYSIWVPLSAQDFSCHRQATFERPKQKNWQHWHVEDHWLLQGRKPAFLWPFPKSALEEIGVEPETALFKVGTAEGKRKIKSLYLVSTDQQEESFAFRKCMIFLFIMTTLSCSVKVSELSSSETEKDKDCPLDVYHNVNNIKRGYKVICLISSKTSYSLYQSHTGAEAIKMAGFRACKYGGDGMIVVSSGRTKFNFWWGRRGVARLKAIKYID